MSTPLGAAGPAGDALPEAVALARGAAEARLPLKLFGGLAIRVLGPGLPPRTRRGQDMDFACLSMRRKDVAAYLERSDCVPDRRFNNLSGDRQMYFTAPSGRPIDVVVDRLTMCHTLDFRPSFDRLPLTLDAVDLLLSNCRSSNSTRRTHGTSCSCWPRCRWLTPARLLGQDPPRAPGPQRGSTPSGFARFLAPTGAGGGRLPRPWPSCLAWSRAPGTPFRQPAAGPVDAGSPPR